MPIIEKRGKDVVVAGRGGVKKMPMRSEAEARALMNKINFLRDNNKSEAEHQRERPIEVSSK